MQRLILEPDVQKKIQNEIDDVVGQGRLPTLDDRIKYKVFDFLMFIIL